MKIKLQTQWIILLSFAFFLFGCTSTSLESRAGEWDIVTDFGELTLVVDPSGTTITSVKYRIQPCRNGKVISNDLTFVGDIEISNSLPVTSADAMGEIVTSDSLLITSAGGFYLDISGIPEMTILGYFNNSGTRLTGEWNSGCREEFTAKR